MVAVISQLVYVISEAIPPEMNRNNAQCMSQYLLGGCRIPGQQADTLRRNYPPEKRHMIVMRKGHVS